MSNHWYTVLEELRWTLSKHAFELSVWKSKAELKGSWLVVYAVGPVGVDCCERLRQTIWDTVRRVYGKSVRGITFKEATNE